MGSGSTAMGSGASWPAKLRVERARLLDGKLDVLARLSNRANGHRVEVELHARGRMFRFTQVVKDGTVLINRTLPRNQRRASTGIVTITYGGGEYRGDTVRPAESRLRAANGRALLRRGDLTVENGTLSASGTVSARARGVVRLSMTYDLPGGRFGKWEKQATIRNGRWQVEEQLPIEARSGGYLVMQFTGYLPRRMRGEQTAKQVLAG
jgi:hypothetical protein